MIFEKNNQNPQMIFSEELMRYRLLFTDANSEANSQKIVDTD